MGLETQAILYGHVSVDQIVRLLRSELVGSINVRDMQRPEYKIVQFVRVDGSTSTINLFLNSWAAEDYADAFNGPSTFLTAEYSPQNFELLRLIAAANGGLARRTAVEAWADLESARP
jgi:hypothetical protein